MSASRHSTHQNELDSVLVEDIQNPVRIERWLTRVLPH